MYFRNISLSRQKAFHSDKGPVVASYRRQKRTCIGIDSRRLGPSTSYCTAVPRHPDSECRIVWQVVNSNLCANRISMSYLDSFRSEEHHLNSYWWYPLMLMVPSTLKGCLNLKSILSETGGGFYTLSYVGSAAASHKQEMADSAEVCKYQTRVLQLQARKFLAHNSELTRYWCPKSIKGVEAIVHYLYKSGTPSEADCRSGSALEIYI